MSAKNRQLKTIRRMIKSEGSSYRDTIYAAPRPNSRTISLTNAMGQIVSVFPVHGPIEVAAYCGRARYRNYKARTKAEGYKRAVTGPVE